MPLNQTTRRIQFRSHFQVGSGTQIPSGTIVPLVATIDYDLYDPTTLAIDLLLLGNDEEQRSVITSLQRPFHSELWLHSDETGTPSVEVLGIHSLSGGGTHVELGAFEIQVGINDEPQKTETTWIVKVELTPSGILIIPGSRHLSYTGDISFEPIEPGEVEVHTDLGTLQTGIQYAHYNSEEYGNKVLHSVQRAAITGSIKVPQGGNLASVNKVLIDEVEDICTILSFCYRQPVDFYEVWYVTDPNTMPQTDRQEATLRRRRNAIDKRLDSDELIHWNNLINGGLDQLIKNYKKAEHREEITRAIRFLAASYPVEPVESSYFLAYSALDLITSINNAEDVYLLGSAKWKRIQKLLRGYLDSIADAEEIEHVVERLKEKLPELRRVSGDRRVIEACQKLDVKTHDLWRKEGFEEGLKSATKIRNRLFHAAGGDMDDLYVNLIRVRTLVERLILGTLEWPEDRTWVWKNKELARIRST